MPLIPRPDTPSELKRKEVAAYDRQAHEQSTFVVAQGHSHMSVNQRLAALETSVQLLEQSAAANLSMLNAKIDAQFTLLRQETRSNSANLLKVLESIALRLEDSPPKRELFLTQVAVGIVLAWEFLASAFGWGKR